jgi:hypothetical protein
MLSKVIGMRYYQEISQAEHLLSRYNDSMMQAIFILANEATYSGDGRHAAKLKAMITDQMFMVEKKFAGKSMRENFTRLAMASNANHVIRRAHSDRRFSVTDVLSPKEVLGPEKAQEHFQALNAEINGQGPAGLMHFLLTREYDKQDLRTPVETEAGRRQIYLSMSPTMQFWVHCLEIGEVSLQEEDLDVGVMKKSEKIGWHTSSWAAWISKEAFYRAFQQFQRTAHQRVTSTEFFVDFSQMSGIDLKTVKRTVGPGLRKNGFVLPPLPQAIAMLREKFPGVVSHDGADDLPAETIPDEM